MSRFRVLYQHLGKTRNAGTGWAVEKRQDGQVWFNNGNRTLQVAEAALAPVTKAELEKEN